ncbi:MAG: hypothetical protein ACI9OD_004239, partial [Limisphaerales bacterium]
MGMDDSELGSRLGEYAGQIDSDGLALQPLSGLRRQFGCNGLSSYTCLSSLLIRISRPA